MHKLHTITVAFLAVAATAAVGQNTSIKTWLPTIDGVPVPGAQTSSTQANCEAAATARPITQKTAYECKLLLQVTPSGAPVPPPPPPPAPPPPAPPPPAPAPSPGGASIASQIAADMSSPGDSKAHGTESWPSSQGAWSKVAASGLREEYVLPSGWSAVAGWGGVFRDTTNASDTNTRIEIKDFYVYSLSKTGVWKLIQSGPIDGGAYSETWATNDSVSADKRSIMGGVSVKIPKGRNFHFWPGGRGTLDSSYAGIYAVYQARKVIDDPSRPDDRNVAKYIMNAGGDMWQSTSAGYCGLNCANKEIGFSRYKWVTTEWTTVRFTNVPDAKIAANPPPR